MITIIIVLKESFSIYKVPHFVWAEGIFEERHAEEQQVVKTVEL